MCSCLFLSCSLVTPSAHTHTHNWSAAAENIVFIKNTIYLHLNLRHMYNKLKSEDVNCRSTLRSHHRCYFSLKPSFHQKLPPSSTRVNQVSSKHQCFTQSSSTLDFSVQALGYYKKVWGRGSIPKCENVKRLALSYIEFAAWVYCSVVIWNMWLLQKYGVKKLPCFVFW